MKAIDIMTKEFDAILPTATVKEAVTLFKCGFRGEGRKGVNALMVMDENGKLVGLITMSHILKAIMPFYMEMAHLSEFAWEGLFERMCHKIENRLVSDFMEKKVITVDPDANIFEISELMLKSRVRRLPIVEKDKVIGIVYRKELFFKIVETMLEKEVCK
ncbi:HPP family protein [Pseudomonas sp.]|uniref:CBS domain-containing protein n=1 Tax=Pseudomonas sp. TaxID=306 RepID=UPI00271AD1C0|nr:CBS domain-containing protein [Pseudomonas sp.]MDO8707077.1 CBS domain-containing protein [Pseudomonas sp.]